MKSMVANVVLMKDQLLPPPFYLLAEILNFLAGICISLHKQYLTCNTIVCWHKGPNKDIRARLQQVTNFVGV